MVQIEDIIKAKLGIKYLAAKQLVAEAKANLEITDDGADREDEIVDEATQIFEDDMMPEEQEAMRVTGKVESGFKQRAVAAAQRKEAAARREETTPVQSSSDSSPIIDQPVQGDEAVDEVVEQKVAPEEDEGEQFEEIVEQIVEGDGGAGGRTTVTETTITHVAADGTTLVTTKTVKKKSIETQEKKVVCFCTIL